MMLANSNQFAIRVSVVAVHGALIAMACLSNAYAEDDEPTVASLTTPVKTLSVGAINVDKSSAKFGEYNGLNKSGLYSDINVDLRGGGSFDSGDTTRWRVTGNDLGIDGNREAKVEFGQQGRFKLNFGYDELTHSRSDTFQTPFQGVGTNNLTLPANWTAPIYQTGGLGGSANAQTYTPAASFFGLAATSYTSPLVVNSAFLCKTTSGTAIGVGAGALGCAANAAFGGAYTTGLAVNAANTAMLANNLADLNDFHNQDLSVKRTKTNLDLALELDSQWSFKAGWKHEDKKGLQAKGVVTGAGGTAVAGGAGVGGEFSTILPMLVDQKHDQYTASLDFRNDKAFGSIAYYGSYFRNNNPSMTVANALGSSIYNGFVSNAYGGAASTITSEPDNMFNQLSLTGGYNLTETTRLVADASYGRNTQNAGYILSPEVFGTPTGVGITGAPGNGSYVPASSLNGAVTSKSFDLKLTDKSIDKLRLSGAYKYDVRDNSTPINTYMFADASGPGSKNLTSSALSVLNGAIIAGLPAGTTIYSNDNVYVNRAYSKKVNQFNFDASYDFSKNQAVKLGFDWQNITRYCGGSWSDCAFVDSATDKTLRAEYRFTASEDIKGRVAYDYSERHVDYNADAWMSLVPALNATNITALVAQGWTGSILQFMKTFGLSVNGLLIPQNATTGAAANALPTALASALPAPAFNNAMSAQQVTNVYNLLFGGALNAGAGNGSGNGALAKAYMGSNNNFQNMNGLDIYSMASRNRDKLRGSVDWQASERLAFQVGGSYSSDKYPDSSFGLTDTKNLALNLDASFAPNDYLTLNAYYSYEEQKSSMASSTIANGSQNGISATGTAYTTAAGLTGTNTTVQGGCVPAGVANQYQWEQANLKTDSCWNWGSEMRDKTHTLGLAFTKKSFLSSKFDIKGDLSFTQSVSKNHISGGSYQANPESALLAGVPALIYINNADLPDITNKVWRLRLSGLYKVDKSSSVRVNYMVAKLTSDDYGWQTTVITTASGSPTTSGVVPTYEQAPSYKVQTLGVTYLYTF